MKYKLKRTVSTTECPWLDENIEKGSIVYKYYGHTYGCISPLGIACTMKEGETPFLEIPRDSLELEEEEK